MFCTFSVQFSFFFFHQVNAIDGYGRSALHYAAEVDSNCVELLLMQNETLVDIGDGNQNTPLHWASYKNNVESMIILLDRGADVDAMDFNHETPLSWAAKKSNLEAVKVLLQYNAKPNIVDFNGYMPLEHVANMIARGLGGNLEDTVMELLLKAMGQFDLRDDTGQLSKPISSDNKLNEILVPYCVGARPLKELCRYTIRSYLGRSYLPNIIPRLPVPVPLQEYLQLQRWPHL